MPDVLMPRLSDSMEQGTIIRWLRGANELVERGQDLVEIETDKATVIFEAEASGELEILAEEGSSLAVGELIARIGAGTSAAPAAQSASSVEGDAEPLRESVDESSVKASSEPAERGSGRGKVSPLARRLAEKLGLSLAGVTGSGPRGRILKADVLLHIADGQAHAGEPAPVSGEGLTQVPDPAPPGVPATLDRSRTTGGPQTARGRHQTLDLTRAQATMARRMAESKATAPDFSISMEVDMDAAVRLRGELREAAERLGDTERMVVPTYNDMVIRACGLALREHPRVNSSYRDGRVDQHERVNVGFASAVEEAILVPTVFDADARSLSDIARETRRLNERARAGQASPPELSGATFTVSNLGMYGTRRFTAIINPPQAAIVSVGALVELPVIKDGQVSAGWRMDMTLSCDHRLLTGAQAASFLARTCELLASPLTLLAGA